FAEYPSGPRAHRRAPSGTVGDRAAMGYHSWRDSNRGIVSAGGKLVDVRKRAANGPSDGAAVAPPSRPYSKRRVIQSAELVGQWTETRHLGHCQGSAANRPALAVLDWLLPVALNLWNSL